MARDLRELMNDQQTRSIATPAVSQRASSALAEVLAELWRHKFVIPAVAAFVTAVVAFWTLRQTKIYEATATLEYDHTPSMPLGDAVKDPNRSPASWVDVKEFYETQNFILRSRTQAERVALALRLHQDADFMSADEDGKDVQSGSIQSAVGRLLKAVTITQVRDTRVVRINVRDHNPERAKRIANQWVEAYIEKSLEDRLGTSTSAMQWLSDQMQNLKSEVETSELALYKYREQHHSLSAALGERQRVIGGQLESYNDTLTEIHAKRIQTEARLSVLRELLSSDPDLLTLQAATFANDRELVELRAKHRSEVEALNRLSITYGEAHPQVRAARNSADSLLAQVRMRTSAIVRATEAELREYDRAEKGIRAALEDVNRRGLALSLEEIDYSRLDRERTSKARMYELVMQRAAETDLTRALRVAKGRVIDPAIAPTVAVSPRIRLAISLGVLFGLVFGVVAALGIAVLDNKIRGPADIEVRGVSVLGVLPVVGSDNPRRVYGREKRRRARRIENHERDLMVYLDPRSNAAECCRTIRTNITFQSAERALHTIAVTSAMPRDGKTMISLSIAAVLAQSGQRVLLIDTDMRKPRLHRAFKLPSGSGVSSILAGETTLEESIQETEVPGVMLLQCGPIPPNPSELLHTRRFSDLIARARESFDSVILDTPPLGAVTDPAVIATQVDGTIVVVRSGTTTRAGVDAALRQLHSVSARIVGVVLNGVDLSDSNYGSYYAYYRGYYAEDGTDPTPPRSSATSA
jgi:polysaccharide biosynthesis transport protein